jgi:hypothetical protein
VVDLIREGFVQPDGLDREHRDVIFLAEVEGVWFLFRISQKTFESHKYGILKAHNLRNKTRNSCGLLQEMIDFTLPVLSRSSAGHLVGPC